MGLTLQDFDFYEIHEAFSGQILCTLAAWENADYCRGTLGLEAPLGRIDRSRLNVNGGSVGLGHPFAATGARIVASAAKQLALHREQTGRSGLTLVRMRGRRTRRYGDPGRLGPVSHAHDAIPAHSLFSCEMNARPAGPGGASFL